MDRLQIVVELTFNGNRVGCGALGGDSSEPIEAFHGSGKADDYPRDISIFQKIWPPQPQRVDGRERERYQDAVVRPFRRLLEEMTPRCWNWIPTLTRLGAPGRTFRRINRDIRFAKDKTLYKTQMYLKFFRSRAGKSAETASSTLGISKDTVTAGFRIYSDAKRKESTLALIAERGRCQAKSGRQSRRSASAAVTKATGTRP